MIAEIGGLTQGVTTPQLLYMLLFYLVVRALRDL